MSSVKPIQTVYRGYRFRSRLEARWAVAFDCMGVKWEYEPEGFELSHGRRYLPDFRVKCWGTRGDYSGPPFDLYIEVKGHMTFKDAEKIWEFSGERHENPVLIVGNIPDEGMCHDSVGVGAYEPMDGIAVSPFNYDFIDGDNFAAYPAAHKGRFYLWGDDSNYINPDDVEQMECAYRIARQARFEHGETPRGSVQRRW